MNGATSRTRQPPMPPSIPNPSSLLLGLAHPVRNNENSNQLLDRHAPTLRQIFQLEENPAIQNLHEFHRLLTVAQLRSTPPNYPNTLWLYMAHLLFLENNVQSNPQSIKSQPSHCGVHASMLPRRPKESHGQRRPNPKPRTWRHSGQNGSKRYLWNRPGKDRGQARTRRNTWSRSQRHNRKSREVRDPVQAWRPG